MANVKKINRMGVGHLFAHFERRDGVRFGNQEIDISRSILNYNLAPDRLNEDGTKMTQYEFLESRMKDLHYTNKKDLNVMCSWVITLPDEVKPEEEQKFFKLAYDFLANRYGEKNVISSYVHKDETTPHMHFAFIPVVEHMKHKVYGKDEYTYEDTINAKKVISKTELQQFHPDLNNFMAQQFGRNLKIAQYSVDPTTGELVSITKLNGNKKIKELKKEQIYYQNEVVNLKNTNEVLLKERDLALDMKLAAIEAASKAKKEFEEHQLELKKLYEDIDNAKREKETILLLRNNCENDINNLNDKFDLLVNEYNNILQNSKELDNEFWNNFEVKDFDNIINKDRNVTEKNNVYVGKNLWEKIRDFIKKVFDFGEKKEQLFGDIKDIGSELNKYKSKFLESDVVNNKEKNNDLEQ